MCDPEPPDTGQPSGTAAAFIARRQSNKEHDFKVVRTCQSLEQESLYRFIKHRHCLDGTVAFNITKATLNPSHLCRNPLVKPRWLHQRQAQGTGDAQPRERKVKVHSVLHCPNSEWHGSEQRHECCAKHAPVAARSMPRTRATDLLQKRHTSD
ncbi:hypothetical protein EDD86DRAFT_272113 [Gorgonomyces haynaldii]|nr:hypothetical protein EDD86DRAFT_272113 [Gorgonomyces haynaldii]